MCWGMLRLQLRTKIESLLLLQDSSLESLDGEVKQIMGRNKKRKDQIVFKEFTQEELDILILNRSKMNKPEAILY